MARFYIYCTKDDCDWVRGPFKTEEKAQEVGLEHEQPGHPLKIEETSLEAGKDFALEETRGERRVYRCMYCKREFRTFYLVKEHIRKSHARETVSQ